MLRKITKIWSYTGKVSGLWRRAKPMQSPGVSIGSRSYRLVKSSHEATLEQFIRCIVDGDYRCLVLEGSPPDMAVFEAWRDVYEGYMDGMKDDKRQRVMKVASQVNILAAKIQLADLIITRLEYEYDPKCLEELRKLVAVPKGLYWDTPVNRLRSIERLKSMRLNLERQLADREIEYRRITPVQKDGKNRADRSMFTDLIVAVSKHMQFRVDRHTIPLSEFVGMVVDMREKFETERKRAQKTKYGG